MASAAKPSSRAVADAECIVGPYNQLAVNHTNAGWLRYARHDGKCRMKAPCVYIVASKRNGTLYTGVTSDLARRAYEHRMGLVEGFTKRYGCKTLVWHEPHDRMDEAIEREKQIQGGSRAKKLALIEAMNPDWIDLYETLNN